MGLRRLQRKKIRIRIPKNAMLANLRAAAAKSGIDLLETVQYVSKAVLPEGEKKMAVLLILGADDPRFSFIFT